MEPVPYKDVMNRIFFKPEGAVLGDVMPFEKDGLFYLYYLRDELVLNANK
jgi:hypothetical protein